MSINISRLIPTVFLLICIPGYSCNECMCDSAGDCDSCASALCISTPEVQECIGTGSDCKGTCMIKCGIGNHKLNPQHGYLPKSP